MRKQIFLAVVLFTISTIAPVSAQQFVWDLGLNYRFDNREYKDQPTVTSETLYGSRLTPLVGVEWNGQHAIMAGADLMSDFGHRTFFTSPEFVAYYRYRTERFALYAGVVPRRNVTGYYSDAFFSDSLRFYDSNIDGLLLQYEGKRGSIEFGCDWNSMYSSDRREKFMLFSSGRIRQGVAYAGYAFDMYHHAGSYTEKGVVDNVLVSPYVGLDLADRSGFQTFSIQAAWIQAFQNDRKYVGDYVRPGGAQFDFEIKRWGVGIKESFYKGDNLMPYYDSPYENEAGDHYGYNLYFGSPFYRNKTYNRLELYWEPVVWRDLKAHIGTVHHYDGNKWGWQQVVTLSVNINSDMFRSRRQHNQ